MEERSDIELLRDGANYVETGSERKIESAEGTRTRADEVMRGRTTMTSKMVAQPNHHF